MPETGVGEMIIFGVMCLVVAMCVVIDLAACMRSSQVSREMGDDDDC